jgi:hypothetical protein
MQPPIDGVPTNQVHWYNLRRLSYEHKPGQKDEWSLPSEISPERALAYFERDSGLGPYLAICGDADRSAEFLLEERQVVRTQFGASQRMRPGDLVRTLAVRRTTLDASAGAK